MMKKIAKNVICMGLALCMGTSMVACGGGGGNKNSGVCEVKVKVVGYGVDWLTEAVSQFNAMYESEGYKVKVTLADTDTGMNMEMQTPKRNTTDLYFDSYESIKPLIEKSRSVLGSNGGALLEDLSDVLSSKAIGKDKQEQGDAISERIESFEVDLCKYTGTYSGYDGVYGLPWYGGSGGLYVNKKVLAQKGYTMDAFLTSNSVIEMTAALAPAADKRLDRNEFFPVTWPGLSAGYWMYWTNVLQAQYMGEEEYKNFYNLIPEGGESEMISSGWTVYEDRGIYETLKVAETLTNKDWAVPGTASMNMISAQARLFEGTSLYMASGDWIYKEMEQDYAQYLDDVIAVKNPVISALGVKLGLCGQTHAEPAFDKANFVEDYSCANCETKLRAVVKAVDGTKTNAQIASEEGVTEAQVATIRERRGYYNATNGGAAIIPSYSDQKEVAKLFLRFLCSDDGIDIYEEHARANFIVKRVNAHDVSKLSEVEASVYERMYGANAKPTWTKSTSPVRVINGFSTYPAGETDKGTFSSLSYSHISETPKFTAKSCYFDSVDIVRGNWADWLFTAGLVG